MAKTKSCKRCGEVIFKINPVCENSEAICIVCNEKIYINCGEYSTYESKCKRERERERVVQMNFIPVIKKI